MYQQSTDRFLKEVRRLEGQGIEGLYPELLLLLSNLEFSEAEAKEHWKNIRKHHKDLSKRLARKIDFRVALLDYFIDIENRYVSPKILEIQLFIETENSALIDELTQVYNYRHFTKVLQQELDRATRYGTQLCLLMLDIDDFKNYNDRNGHLEGNQVLRRLARILAKSTRKSDTLARFGGEEFAIILPDTPKEGADATTNRILDNIHAGRFKYGKHQPTGRLSVSGGVSNMPVDAATSTELIERADKALYRAKEEGKDRIYFFSSDFRASARVKKKLKGTYFRVSPDASPLETVNLSQGGIAVRVREPLPVGSVVQVNLSLPGRRNPLEALGKVVETKKVPRGKKYVSSLRFIECNRGDSQLLQRFLSEQIQP